MTTATFTVIADEPDHASHGVVAETTMLLRQR